MPDKPHSRGYNETLYKDWNALLQRQGLGVDAGENNPGMGETCIEIGDQQAMSEYEYDSLSYSKLLDIMNAGYSKFTTVHRIPE